jgi:acetolactate synthase regulatory subunit
MRIKFKRIGMTFQEIEIRVVNSATVIIKVIQITKRRRINIKRLLAEVDELNPEDGKIKMTVEVDDEKRRLLLSQLNKAIDVIKAQ